MPIEKLNFDEVSEDDLQELVTGGVPEGLKIEYKSQTYGNSDANKRELLKDVSAFANMRGGHLIIGMEAAQGAASNAVGLSGIDVDAEMQRLDQLIRTGIERKIIGYRIRSIPLANGNNIIVIRIPHSWNPPHRVSAHGSNRIYIRNSSGVHEASMDELENLFMYRGQVLERVREFREQRVSSICAGEGVRPLQSNGRLILHIVPLSAFSEGTLVDLEEVNRQNASFRPMGATAFNPRFNYDGVIVERPAAQNFGYTQIYRNGVLEATKAEIISRNAQNVPIIDSADFEHKIIEAVPLYLEGLRVVGVMPPLVVMVSLEGILGVTYTIRAHDYAAFPAPSDRQLLLLPECTIGDYGTNADYERQIKPAFDALWNCFGHARSRYYNAEGGWTGNFQQ